MIVSYQNNAKNALSKISPHYKFNLYEKAHNERAKVELAVKKVFSKSYQADVNEFLPFMFSLEQEGELLAAVGIRNANNQSLFVEKYLATPIQKIISKDSKQFVARNDVVEIGNLISEKAGMSQLLFILLAFSLEKLQIRWVSYTATAQVEKLLSKLNLSPVVITQAQESDVANGLSHWGSYYQNQPKVCYGDVKQACRQLRNNKRVTAYLSQYQKNIKQVTAQLQKGLFND